MRPAVDSAERSVEQVEYLSASARRLLRRPRPRFRGTLHRWATVAWIPLGTALVAAASGGRETVAAAAFAAGTWFMLATSALVHSRDWGVNQVETLVRLDHSAIFAMFATSGTPIAWLGLDGAPSRWMLVFLWTGAALGILAEWLPVHPPRGLMNAAYLTFGWGCVAFVPWLVTDLGLGRLALLLGGGLAYTAGAVVVGARRPDPWPDSFGYHEIWHVLVVVAVVAHTALVADLVGV